MEAEKDFWERLDQIEAGILGVKGTDMKMPIAPSLRYEGDGAIWFIATQGLSLVTAVTVAPLEAEFVIADSKSGLYAAVEGMLSHVDDETIIDELWSPLVASWLDDTNRDASLRLLRLVPETGYAWYSSVSGLEFLYDIGEPDSGAYASTTSQTAKIAFSPSK